MPLQNVGGADIPQYTTNKDVLVFGLFFGHGVFCTIDERISGTAITVAGVAVCTASGGR